MPTPRELLEIARDLQRQPSPSPPLGDMAFRAGWSAFHLHRAFTRFMGETPKQYALRLRLERAAASLAATARPVRRIALDAGFGSHEVFTRAFRRRYGSTPAEYRRRAQRGATPAERARHAEQIEVAGPCVRLHHVSLDPSFRRRPMPMLSIERRELAAQPVVFARVKTSRTDLPAAIADGLGRTYARVQQEGLAIAGPPYVRYAEVSPGLMTIEAGFPLAAAASGGGEIHAGTLPGGAIVVALHGGPYDRLQDTYAEIERWLESNGLRGNGPMWESYLTDPAEVPDPANWRTEVYWPVM
ncbi:MAG TPA: AraC family transcriptional regulator [Vicinamibacterales bacterium]|nr:AraC family transcriptional regulator [Vicinamibacterales bacterium]